MRAVPRIYADHNATTPLGRGVREAMLAALDCPGNPSSLHAEGRLARELVEEARAEVAAFVGTEASEIVFTSGGTEADALGIIALARLAASERRPRRLIVPPIEHPAVLGAATALAGEGFAVEWVRVDGAGRVDREQFAALCRGGAALAALALANHEIGTVQDVAGLAAIAHDAGVLVHCDAVQAAGKIAVDAAALGVDALALSAHKFHGPKGIGALWLRRGLDVAAPAGGGQQERGRRAGTENVPGIAGMAAALRLLREEGLLCATPAAAVAAHFEAGLGAIEGVRVHGAGAPRVGNTVSVGLSGALGEVVVAALDLHGIAAATGAACSSGSTAPSPGLLALGLSRDEAREVVRFSFGRGSSTADADSILGILPEVLARARRYR